MASQLSDRYRMPYLENPGPNEFHYNLYNYRTNLGLGIFGAIAFGITLVIHIIHTVRYKRTRASHILMSIFCVSFGFARCSVFAVLQHKNVKVRTLTSRLSRWSFTAFAPPAALTSTEVTSLSGNMYSISL